MLPLDGAQDLPPFFWDKARYPINSLCPFQHRAKQLKRNLLHSAGVIEHDQKAVTLGQLEVLASPRSNAHLEVSQELKWTNLKVAENFRKISAHRQ